MSNKCPICNCYYPKGEVCINQESHELSQRSKDAVALSKGIESALGKELRELTTMLKELNETIKRI